MNLLKKVYCRSVQGVLRASLPVLPYRQPQRLTSIGELPRIFRQEHAGAVLLITDDGVRRCGLTQDVERILWENRIHCVVYDRTVPNPTSENVEEATALYHREGCQAIIGLGGGSSIDCAKAVGARVARPLQSLQKMEGVLRAHCTLPPTVAIPTTAGTGSEITLAAVITDSTTHHKYAIMDFCLIPRYVIHDPELTRSLPQSLTATTALDALTHAIEAYIGRSTTRETRGDALEAVRLIFENLDTAYEDGNHMVARQNLLIAAYLAGNAFSKSYVGYVHAIGHSLSGKYGLAHGYTMAILLPWVLEFYGPVVHKKLARLAQAAGIADDSADPAQAAADLIAAIRERNRRYGLPDYFKELRREDIPELARTADHEANPLYPVPVLLSARALEPIYQLVTPEAAAARHTLEVEA